MRGPSAPNRCGGKPRASRRACRRPTSLSSLSESGWGTAAAPAAPRFAEDAAPPVAPAALAMFSMLTSMAVVDVPAALDDPKLVVL